MKKGLSIILSLAMVFAMSSTAFAASPSETRNNQGMTKTEFVAACKENKQAHTRSNISFSADEAESLISKYAISDASTKAQGCVPNFV